MLSRFRKWETYFGVAGKVRLAINALLVKMGGLVGSGKVITKCPLG